MKLKELFEEHAAQDLYGEKLINEIKANCGQFIKESGGLPCYRGMSEKTQVFQKSRDDSSPRDSSYGLTSMISLYVEYRFHIDNIRRKNRFYGVGYKGATREYVVDSDGYVYWIFPVDGYKYVWSPEIQDATADFGGITFDLEQRLVKLEKMSKERATESVRIFKKSLAVNKHVRLNDFFEDGDNELDKELQMVLKAWFEYMDDLDYTNKHLKDALTSGNEITFQGKGYYAVPEDESKDAYKKFYERLTT